MQRRDWLDAACQAECDEFSDGRVNPAEERFETALQLQLLHLCNEEERRHHKCSTEPLA